MKILKTMKAMAWQFENGRAIGDAMKFDKQMKKMKTDKFIRRFASTTAGYFPEQPKVSFWQKLFRK